MTTRPASPADASHAAVVVALALAFAPHAARAQSDDGSAEVRRLLAAQNPPGTLAGFPAQYRVETTGRGAGRATYASIHAEIPDPGVLLLAHPVYPSDDSPRDPHAIDVQVGEPAFDAAYVVEGAPSDEVRVLLDAPVRSAMLDANAHGVIVDIDGRFADVSRGGVPANADEARQLVAVASLVAAHLRAGLVPAPADALTPAARAAELSRLRALREHRRAAMLPFLALMGLVGIAVIALLARNIARRGGAPPRR